MKKNKFIDNNYDNQQYYDDSQQYYNNSTSYDNNNQQYYSDNTSYDNNNQQYYDDNQQYGNSYGYNYSNKKKKEKSGGFDLRIIIGIVALVFVVIFIILIIALSSGSKKNSKKDNQPIFREETRVIGNNLYGYLTIPGEWVVLNDVIQQNGIEYSDVTNTFTITLNLFENITMDDFLPRLKSRFREKGFSNLHEDTIANKGINMYRLYGYSDIEQLWVLVLCFPGENDSVHFIELDGPDIEHAYFNTIPYSFSYKSS